MSEMLKIKPIIEKYLTSKNKILDIGCGETKVCPSAIGVDTRIASHADFILKYSDDIYRLYEKDALNECDVIFSSHMLEHLKYPFKFLCTCYKLLKKDGLLILYLPDARHYDNESNVEHLQSYEHLTFVRWFGLVFKNELKLIESGTDLGENRYSFYLISKKIQI